MTDANIVPASTPEPALPADPQARQIALLEKIVEQQAKLLAGTELQIRILHEGGQKTRVTDFGMPFFSMVGLFLEAAIAAIPAAIILGIGWFFVMLLFGGVFAALSR